MSNGMGGLSQDRVRASSRVLDGHVLGLSALVLLLSCGGSAAPGASAGAGGAAQGASGASVSSDPPASAGSGASGSGAPAGGGAAQGGNSPGPSEGGAFEAGSGGLPQGGASSEPTLEPVRVTRGDPLENGWQDLTIRGVALADYEGKVVTVRLGMPDRAPERLGSGQARIEAGAFELFFPEVWESSLYKSKLVYIDVDGDGSCDPLKDRLFADSRAVVAPELTVRGSGAAQRADLSTSSDPGHCAAFNSDWPNQ